LLLGLILIAAVFLGDAAERVGVPWITGCILGGVLLGPDAFDVLTPGVQSAFGPCSQASLALIAFNIGSRLTGAKLRAIGGGIGFLTLLQLLAPLFAVLGGHRDRRLLLADRLHRGRRRAGDRAGMGTSRHPCGRSAHTRR
jgi:Kef-type K+ transport system membrane component KefB